MEQRKKTKQNHRPVSPYLQGKTKQTEEKTAETTREGQCPLYKKCNGCQLQNMTYDQQLRWKQKKVEQRLGRFHEVSPILGMEHPYHYRNKVQAAFGMNRSGQIISGVYQSTTGRIVPVDTCLIEDEKADQIVVSIRKLMKSFRMTPYQSDKGMGFLRHVLVKRGFVSGEIMVVLVTTSPIFPAKNNFVKALRREHPEITTILMNVSKGDVNLVLGEQEKVLFGPGSIEETLCGCRFRISAKSFYQVNPVQTEVLYQKAIELAGLTGKETVLDAYCGIGTIGLIASRHAKQVIGVEVNRDAVRDAIANAKRNQIKNIYFHHADAGELMTAMAADKEKVDVVFMDPPRSGSDEAFLSAVTVLAPDRLVYISCNPDTQERDLAYLTAHGYQVQTIQPVDMFPHTHHIETVCLLSKLNAKQHIEVEIKMDELDLTSVESKATYDEIKAYILQKHGLKVSSLYIAQVKQKCGIIERVNYNKPKSKDTRQPQCPLEKEIAIIDAFRYFKML